MIGIGLDLRGGEDVASPAGTRRIQSAQIRLTGSGRELRTRLPECPALFILEVSGARPEECRTGSNGQNTTLMDREIDR